MKTTLTSLRIPTMLLVDLHITARRQDTTVTALLVAAAAKVVADGAKQPKKRALRKGGAK